MLLIAVPLTWLALGHTGPGKLSGDVRWRPFDEYISALGCIANDCGSWRTAVWFLAINGLGNIVVFMPLGTALYVALHGLRERPNRALVWATLVGGAISTLYEVAQLWIPGRVTAMDDVILNAGGTLAEAWILWLLVHLRRSSWLVIGHDDG